ncbi:signal peptidase I [Candidatus Hakubella thermalkaliphila]|uniref:Signal peptidase I n=1 Tax=Candidatus Hakubella thermalkaliphila TaxID=2754717 RepID=A0A6V8Q2L6_9ACTN|nr:signal peptidase I [Candidatus Hakubella thermalkaliphila]GFP24112.1 signal peptidase I [Candidatus Hakubella thermalkaliphila]GFP29824.1 signal peptidase I [Candidatus Hakubella thermalkaliphila]GFP37191.1 signal peptidase I [Candidatus Hakubella thermalkaliphila]GFP38827.1 signal peptidase I [Candidatus Hakubella thermalkaliphila]GFP42210.1 signal peptidase I [Candidatus Hakubella thermalkaliphila]
MANNSSRTSSWAEYLVVIAIAVALAFFIRTFIAQPFLVDKESMHPTLLEGNYIIINKFIYYFSRPQKGDIVVFYSPQEQAHLIKRVIGSEGDKIEILQDGQVVLNGRLLEEPYASYASYGVDAESGAITLGPGEYFVMGDNRGNSLDSRWFGPIKESSIKGRAFVLLWPFSRFRFLQ